MTTVQETNLPNLAYRGKVRDTYDLGEGLLLMIATDRISAFDVVLPTPIPEKGTVLCQLSAFWFGQTSHIVPNHVGVATPQANPAAAGSRTGASHKAQAIMLKLKKTGVRAGVRK